MKWDGEHVYKVTGGILVVRIKRKGDKVIISEHSTDGTSLTNCIETVIEDLANSYGEPVKDLDWYQWCEGEGLFELEIGGKVTRAMPNFQVKSWIRIAKELTAFEVLFT